MNNIPVNSSGSSEKEEVDTHSEDSVFNYGGCHLIWDLGNRVWISGYKRKGRLHAGNNSEMCTGGAKQSNRLLKQGNKQ